MSVVLLTMCSLLLYVVPAFASSYGRSNGYIVQLLVTIGTIIVIFLLLREVNCWYWKINERNALLRDIKTLLEQSNKNFSGLPNHAAKKNRKRLLISSVTEGGQAEQIGIKAGDILTTYDNTTIATDSELSKAISMAKYEKKKEIQIEILRGDHIETLTATTSPLGIQCVDKDYDA